MTTCPARLRVLVFAWFHRLLSFACVALLPQVSSAEIVYSGLVNRSIVGQPNVNQELKIDIAGNLASTEDDFTLQVSVSSNATVGSNFVGPSTPVAAALSPFPFIENFAFGDPFPEYAEYGGGSLLFWHTQVPSTGDFFGNRTGYVAMKSPTFRGWIQVEISNFDRLSPPYPAIKVIDYAYTETASEPIAMGQKYSDLIPDDAMFTPIGPATSRSIAPRDVSSNGKVVVGDVVLEDGQTHPFRWAKGEFTLLADASVGGTATGVSADGLTIAVTLWDDAGRGVPYRWTAAGLEPLALFPGDSNQSLITGRISKDGSTILGRGWFTGPLGIQLGGMRWISTELEAFPGMYPPVAISDDAGVIVGDRTTHDGLPYGDGRPNFEAVRWTAAEGVTALDVSNVDTYAVAVSGNGAVVVGQASGYGLYQVFRWTSESGYEYLPSNLPTRYNRPTAVSGDGNIILGVAAEGETYPKDATIWIAGGEVELLKTHLLAYGIRSTTFNEWQLSEAQGISPNGRFIAGHGVNREGLKQMFLVDRGPQTPPIITSSSSASATFASPFVYTITAAHYPESFDAFALPAGLSVDATSGVISGVPAEVGSFSVALVALNGGGEGLALLNLTVAKALAGVTFSNTTQAYTGTARSISVETDPVGLATVVTYAGDGAPPSLPGTYQVDAVVDDANYQGSAVGALTITPPPSPVITSATSAIATYHSSFSYTITATNDPQTFTASPLPAGLSLDANTGTISGLPSLAGSFDINLTATNPGGVGVGTLTLQVEKASASVAISNTSQVYTGAPRPVTITTTPAGLSTDVTYNGVSSAPSSPGTYAVSATISDTNHHGAAAAVLNIYTSTLQILTQPSDLTVVAGAPATFAVKASGPGVLSYVWRKGNGANSPIVSTTATFTIGSTTLADAGTYRVTVSNGTSSVSSVAAKLVVTGSTVVVAPAIVQQPLSQTVTITNPKKLPSVTFSVTATGTGPLSYQWKRNGVDVSGATSSALTVSKVALTENGAQFQVRVSNAAGSVLSNIATLTVK